MESERKERELNRKASLIEIVREKKEEKEESESVTFLSASKLSLHSNSGVCDPKDFRNPFVGKNVENTPQKEKNEENTFNIRPKGWTDGYLYTNIDVWLSCNEDIYRLFDFLSRNA